MDFTIEESNLISIYAADTRSDTIANLRAALPFIDEAEMREVFNTALRKLDAMSDTTFADTDTEPIYPVIFSEDEHGF